jgi:hypothetical protein
MFCSPCRVFSVRVPTRKIRLERSPVGRRTKVGLF